MHGTTSKQRRTTSSTRSYHALPVSSLDRRAAGAQRQMIERLRALGTSERTLAAFARVPRYRLVPRFWLPSDGAEVAVDDDPAAALALLYDVDRAVAVNHVPGARGGTTSTASAPRVLTAQADVMAVEPGMAVLEIGTGPGYFAAVLAE